MNEKDDVPRSRARWPRPDARQRSEALKERIYVSFTALAVVLTLQRETEHASVATAAIALLLTVFGTLLAVFIADVIAHMVRDAGLPTRPEIAHLLWVSFGSLSVTVAPIIVLSVSALGLLSLAVALRIISFILVLTLIVVALIAVWRLRVSPAKKSIALLGIAIFGLGVIAVELAVH